MSSSKVSMAPCLIWAAGVLAIAGSHGMAGGASAILDSFLVQTKRCYFCEGCKATAVTFRCRPYLDVPLGSETESGRRNSGRRRYLSLGDCLNRLRAGVRVCIPYTITPPLAANGRF